MIVVVIPCYKVSSHIIDLINNIGSEVNKIIVVDDMCPEKTAFLVEQECLDPRVIVLKHEENRGVGGAVITGYLEAINFGAEVIVKIDGDGQMDPALIPDFIRPILLGEADYVKGNRFFNLENLSGMPKIRLFGNAFLSFLTKLSAGYWNIFDPTNGFTAIHASLVGYLPFSKISKRYFFETDMLFRLNILGAVVIDVPMMAKYGSEKSNLKIPKVIGEFFVKHIKNFIKRIFYNYYLRDMSVASFELPTGVALLIFGILYGAKHWINSLQSGISAPLGTVMLSSVSLLMGVQFILAFLAYDISSVPKRAIHKSLQKTIW
jgi:glycosyltransferase involved in cell wall biosynthesis